MTSEWQETTSHAIKPLVPEEWFKPLDARIGNFLKPGVVDDLSDLLNSHTRVLVLWDAHGFGVAEFVLCHLLPQLEGHPNLILMHDMFDARYVPSAVPYNGKSIWHGGENEGTDHYTFVVLGNLCSAQEQAIAITDFTSRNRLELHSADHELATGLSSNERSALERDLGDLWQHPGYWFWFTTNTAETPLTYPHWNRDKSIHTVTQLETRIREMEASPFWKARQIFARITGRA